MKSQMMAAVLYGKEHLQVEPVAVPKIGTDDILVRVRVALTCGTDVKVFRRGYHARMIVPPAVFGHELAGDIVAVGERRRRLFTSASGWWRPIRRPATKCFYLPPGPARICARTCCSTTAPTPNTSAFPARIVERNTYEIPEHVSYQDAALVGAAGLRAARPGRDRHPARRYAWP